jgi:mannose-6-phosphate isomerase-like protein (cupin superfamily)
MTESMNIFTMPGDVLVDKTRVSVVRHRVGSSLSLNRMIIRPDGEFQFTATDCIIHVAQGSGKISVGEQDPIHLTPGSYCAIPQGDTICVTNPMPYDLVLAVINNG